MAATDFRWAFSLITAAALNASSAYLIENFTLQSDQTLLTPWLPPSDRLTTFPTPARIVRFLDGTRDDDGFIEFQFGFDFLTEGQLLYLDTNAFSSGAAEYVDSTMKVLKHTGVYVVYQGKVSRPVPNVDLKHGDRGLEDVVFHFTNGVAV